MPQTRNRAMPNTDRHAKPKPGDRSAHFPAIEKKHGKPVRHWLKLIADLGDAKYPEQIAFLRERHEFSQVHANALVMYARGSTTSKRFATPAQYFASLDPAKARTVRAILRAIRTKHPQLELVMAWNQPMLRNGDRYVFGVSVATNHIVIAPFDAKILKSLSPRLTGYEVNKKTVRVPTDWKVDAALLDAMIRPQLAAGDAARGAAKSKKKSKKSSRKSTR
ncbi:MAG: DUF4287 domain-containing protein [Ilumatobacteraceae bacterium]